MYHGTVLPINDFKFNGFEKRTGFSSGFFSNEENRLFGFVTPNKEMAKKYAESKLESFHSKNYTKAVIECVINFSKLTVLDLSDENTFEDNLYDIGFKLWESGYGYGVKDMWKLMDEPQIVNLVFKHGYNAVKLIEDSTGIVDISYGINLNDINSIVKINNVFKV